MVGSISSYREEEWLTNLPLYSVHSIGKLARRIIAGTYFLSLQREINCRQQGSFSFLDIPQ